MLDTEIVTIGQLDICESMSISNAVRNMGQLLNFVYMLQAERLN